MSKKEVKCHRICKRSRKSKNSFNPKWFLIAVIIVCFLCPFAIRVSYDILPEYLGAICFKTHITAGDMLSFCAAALSSIGTIFLGYVTFKQTEKLANQEDDREKADVKRPYFTIENVYTDSKCSDEFCWDGNMYRGSAEKGKCYVVLRNYGEGPAVKTQFNNYSYFGDGENLKRRCQTIGANSYFTIDIDISNIVSEYESKKKLNPEEPLTVEFTYQNILESEYSQSFEIDGWFPRNMDNVEEYYNFSVSQLSVQNPKKERRD
ncbi:MAG: hypothetical protein IKB93_02700 [Clostridia bacterium]|nr:hypothetical protein [Clostridia bacterium]